jgi:UDP-glucose 4-epimerase
MAAMAPGEPGEQLRPDSPRAGGWAYPRHKRAAEEVIEAAELPHPRVELVLAAVYSDWCELVPMYRQIERVADHSMQALVYPGPVDRGLTYVHVDAVADAFVRAVEAFAGDGGMHRLLVGEDQPVTYRQINDAASRAFGYGERPVYRVPAVLARLGAAVFGWWARLRGREPFIRPWMIEMAGEHFEFDLTETRRRLGWEPGGYLGERLDRICRRAAVHRRVWRAKNEARPW